MMVSEVFLATDNHGLCTFYRFRCNICDKNILCDHMGKTDVIRHSKTKSHQDQARSLRLQPRLSFAGSSSTETSKRTEAELKMAVLTQVPMFPWLFTISCHQLSKRFFQILK